MYPKKGILEENIEVQIENEIEKYTILPEFLKWALDCLNEKNDVEIEDRSKTYEMIHKTLTQTQNDLDELTRLRYRGMIEDDFFIAEKNHLIEQIHKLKESLRTTEDRAEKWLELTEKTFIFATYARKAFLTGTLELKKEILLALGKTPLIKDENLYIEPNEWLVPIEKEYPKLEKEYLELELGKSLTTIEKNEALAPIRTQWLRGLDSNQGP